MDDPIVALDGLSVQHHDVLFAMLSSDRVAASLCARIVRAGKVRELEAAIGE